MILLGLAAASQVSQMVDIAPGIVQSYADPLLCLPVVLTTLLLLKWAWTGGVVRRLSIVDCIIALVVFAAAFELILPKFATRYTADPIDVIAYSLGAVLFWRLINRPAAGLPVIFLRTRQFEM